MTKLLFSALALTLGLTATPTFAQTDPKTKSDSEKSKTMADGMTVKTKMADDGKMKLKGKDEKGNRMKGKAKPREGMNGKQHGQHDMQKSTDNGQQAMPAPTQP